MTATRRSTRLRCFAVCPPGVEAITAGELRALGCRVHQHAQGGVTFEATTRQLYAANLWLRTATRVLVRVATFRAAQWSDLEAGVATVDWASFADDGGMVSLRVASHGSRLFHTGAIAERVAAVLDRHGLDVVAAGEREGEGSSRSAGGSDGLRPPLLPVVVRVAHDDVTVSVDSSGDGLYRREWRLDVAKAPLRPTLAAALLLAVGWDASSSLVDPFCGAGTIVIEAARLARGRPPAITRPYGFQSWPAFEAGTWASVQGEATSRARAIPPGVVLRGSDRDAGAVAAARANAARAEVVDDVELTEAPVSACELPAGGGWVLTNPPYGRRVRGSAGADLRNLYARLGQVVAAGGPGWHLGVLTDDRVVATHTGLPLAPVLTTSTGGLPVHLLTTAEIA